LRKSDAKSRTQSVDSVFYGGSADLIQESDVISRLCDNYYWIEGTGVVKGVEHIDSVDEELEICIKIKFEILCDYCDSIDV